MLTLRFRPVDASTAKAIEVRTTYFAVAIKDVLQAMRDAGLGDVQRVDEAFYQPLLIGTVRAPA
jgi:hypothetical protein